MNIFHFISKKISRKGGIATISVSVSMIVIIAAVGITSGFQKEVAAKAVGFSGDIVFTAPGEAITNDRYPINKDLSYIDKILSVKEVEKVSAVSYKPGILKTQSEIQGLFFKGVDSLYDLSFFTDHLIEGSAPDFSGSRPSDQILLSKRLADMLGYSTGDKVTAYFVGESPKVRRFTISGLYDIQLQDMDKTITVVDIRHISHLNGWNENQVSSIEVYLKEGSNRDKMSEVIEDIMIEYSTDEDSSVMVSPIRDHYRTLFDWLDLLDTNVLVLLILMIIVAGFNMISSLLIILIENISLIGILKTLGMTNGSVSKVFLYKGSSIVLKGMLWGNIIALTLLMMQHWFKIVKLDPVNYFISYVPVNLSVVTIIAINVLSFATLLIILLIPTRIISGISPEKTIKVS